MATLPATITPAMARRIEIWPIDRLVPYAQERAHALAEQVAQIAASIVEFGFTNPILVDSNARDHRRPWSSAGCAQVGPRGGAGGGAGPPQRDSAAGIHHRGQQARDERRVGREDAGRGTARSGARRHGPRARWLLRRGTGGAAGEDGDGAAGGCDRRGSRTASPAGHPARRRVVDRNAPADLRRLPGLWQSIRALFGDARANVVDHVAALRHAARVRSISGFKPVPPDEYVRLVRARSRPDIESILAPDGSYFLNIKEHADDGERNLYVMDLVLAHRRQWGWRFVDEFCWRKTDNGVPGGWGNRFKNAWEPVFHFCRQQQIKFRPQAVSHESEDCFDYSPEQPEIDLRQRAAGHRRAGRGRGRRKNQMRGSAAEQPVRRFGGPARRPRAPEQRDRGARAESSQGSHSAPFPRALVEFFVLAFTDAGDVVFDPFMGSGTTMAAAEVLGRIGYGCEISPAYCDVILRRMMNLTGETPILRRRRDVRRGRGGARRPGRPGAESEAERRAAHQAPRAQSALRTEEESPGMTAKSRTTNRAVAGMGERLRASANSPYRSGPSTS